MYIGKAQFSPPDRTGHSQVHAYIHTYLLTYVHTSYLKWLKVKKTAKLLNGVKVENKVRAGKNARRGKFEVFRKTAKVRADMTSHDRLYDRRLPDMTFCFILQSNNRAVSSVEMTIA